MRRLALSRVFLAVALMSATLPSHAVRAESGDDAYLSVREEVGQFRENPSQRKFRHHYEKYIDRLRKIAKEHPKSDRADDALYVAAQLYDELYQVSLVGRDLEDAIAAYEQMATTHPKSNLADDALFRAATLKLEKLGDRDGARALLSRVVDMKPTPDMKPAAAELLSRLPPSKTTVVKNGDSGSKERSLAVVKGEPASTGVRDMGEILKRVEEELAKDAKHASDTTGSAPSSDGVDAGVQQSGDGPVTLVLARPTTKVLPARRVNAVKHEMTTTDSVVKVRLSDAVEVKQGAIPASGDAPRRVFYELTPVKLGKQALKPIDVNDGIIRRVRVGQYSEDTVRLVIEIEGTRDPVVTFKKRPFELMIAIAKSADASAPVVAQVPAPAREVRITAEDMIADGGVSDDDTAIDEAVATAEVRSRLGKTGAPGGISLSEQMGLKIRKVVIDAGHGGHDTGAIGPTGLKEKDVTLAIAKRVKKRLEEKIPGIEVILTRDDDRFLELAERTAIANGTGADLFISIHANANPSRKIHGVETYYLNITSDRYAIRLAQRENAETQGDVTISDLEFILADLAMKSNVDDSIRLGRHVQGSLVGRLRQDHKDVQDLGLKHALFFVLLGSRMPAILVETSFISNRTEEKRLGSVDYQEAVADGVVKGVQRFLDERQANNRY
jgi:N-acetylmuramoyl-L-alanine amidase